MDDVRFEGKALAGRGGRQFAFDASNAAFQFPVEGSKSSIS